MATNQPDQSTIVARVRQARDSPQQLRALFDELSADYGLAEASELWWAAFAARDATET